MGLGVWEVAGTSLFSTMLLHPKAQSGHSKQQETKLACVLLPIRQDTDRESVSQSVGSVRSALEQS